MSLDNPPPEENEFLRLFGLPPTSQHDVPPDFFLPSPEEQKRRLAIETLHQRYLQQLDEYQSPGSPERHDYPPKEPNTGWKIHLNVDPKNVRTVSKFLKDNRFKHKFISGANLEQGKIFTVYFGSKQMAQKQIPIVSDHLDHLLEKPGDNDEIPVAPNIVARFDVTANLANNEFSARAYHQGIPLLNYASEDNLPQSLDQSKRQLSAKYGNYFGGTLTPYQPASTPSS